MNATQPITIPGLQIQDEIGRGTYSTVYRAIRNGRPYAVKVLRQLDGNLEAIKVRFRREAGVLARVRHPGLATIMEVGEVERRPYLVMEYVEGQTLAKAITLAKHLNEEQVLYIAKTLAGALAEVHRRGLVHRDIKPSNIMVDSSGHPRIIDFGFAIQTSGDTIGKTIAGTFLYSAPEQTGMLRRPVDGRADLYALGVLLYECATGRLPFNSDDLGELMRQHAVIPAPDVRTLNPDISPALAAIIAKLLAKDPTDRYQTGEGLMADIKNVETLNLNLFVDGSELLLGSEDERAKQLYEMPLIGRERELTQLQNYWRETMKGYGQVVILTGEVGTGKSRLVREVLRKAEETGAMTLTGRCRENDPMPFAPLREAVEVMLRRFSSLPPIRREQAEKNIRTAMGDFTPLLKQFSPILAEILADVPDIVHDTDALDQYLEAIAKFFQAMARQAGAAIIFLDDGHWLDDSTFQALRHLIGQSHHIPLLLVISSDVESNRLEELSYTTASTQAARFHHITITPLAEDAVGRFVTSYLSSSTIDQRIIRQLTIRSGGNPFAVKEYIEAMIDAGLLRPYWGAWRVDTEGLEALELPQDVIQLSVQRLSELKRDSRDLLAIAAVIGSRFSADFLQQITSARHSRVQEMLVDASQMHLLDVDEAGFYHFIHERIREALLSGRDQLYIRELHQRIAETLDEQNNDDDTIYTVARHYRLGDITRRPDRVYETNYAAGRRALAAYAYEEGYEFLRQAAAVRQQINEPPDPQLLDALSDVCFRTGRAEEAMHHAEQALKGIEDPVRQALLYVRVAHVCAKKRDNVTGWRAVQRAFALLGYSTPQVTVKHIARALGAWAWWQFIDQPLKVGFGRAKGAERERLKVIAKLYEVAGYIAFMTGNNIVTAQLGVRPLHAVYRLGISRELVNIYGSFSVILAVVGLRKMAEKYIRLALATAQKLEDKGAIGHTLYLQAMVNHVSGDTITAANISQTCLEQYGNWLDDFDFSAANGDLVLNLLSRGYVQRAQKWLQAALNWSAIKSSALFLPYAATVWAMTGRPTEAKALLKECRESVTANLSDTYRRSLLIGHEVWFYVEMQEFGRPYELAIEEHKLLAINPARATYHLRYFYLAQAYGRLAQMMKLGETERDEFKPKLEDALQELEKTAQMPVLKAHYCVVQAGWLVLQKKLDKAAASLAQAEALAIQTDAPLVLFEVARWRAYLLKEQKNTGMAEQHARLAYALAVEHGWAGRARQVRGIFNLSEHSIGSSHQGTLSMGSNRSASPSADTMSIRIQRYLDALLQVSLTSSQVLDPHQQAHVALDELVRISGAERAYLFLVDENTEELQFLAGRDAQKANLDQLAGYSQTVVEKVRTGRQPLMVSGSEEGRLLGSQSIIAQDIRSIISAPLLLQEKLVGVLYLDNRLVRGVFNEEDMQVLQAIGNHIAIALQTSQMIELIRERTEALRHAYTQLERLDHTKSDFIAIASHELRTPLTILSNYCQLLRRDTTIQANEHHLKLVDGIFKGSQRLHEIINAMLDMAKLDSRVLQLEPQKVNLVEVIEGVCRELEGPAHERNIVLTWQKLYEVELPIIEADKEGLQKVFYNLVINGIKYTPDGGQVIVTGRVVSKEQDEVEFDGIKILVSDTGIGIDPEYHDLIFGKFYQTGEVTVHSSGKTKFKGGGPGLGLTIVKGIIEAHNGRVWVESLGHDEENFPGSQFHVLLPFTQQFGSRNEEIVPTLLP